MTPNISGISSSQAESLGHHNWGHRPQYTDRKIQTESLAHHNWGHRPQIYRLKA
jgi:hypothetical protein